MKYNDISIEQLELISTIYDCVCDADSHTIIMNNKEGWQKLIDCMSDIASAILSLVYDTINLVIKFFKKIYRFCEKMGLFNKNKNQKYERKRYTKEQVLLAVSKHKKKR